MSADAAQRAFERFFRADPSRSRRSGGSGLGLAIVQSVVAAHGGSVRLDSSPRTGTSVRVELPFDTANRG
jgi:two-component system OmpR family sensor kinase